MHFTKGYYRHNNSLDVFFEVIKVQYVDHKRAKLRGRWWNLGWVGEPFLVYPGNPVTVEIKKEEFRNWKYLYNTQRFVDRN